ncbi:MAG: PaaI family thioesterase [Actinomycetes bacterium]
MSEVRYAMDDLVSPDEMNAWTEGHLPGLVGFTATRVERGRLEARLSVREDLTAPNGYLHAATVVALADTACGFGCRTLLPEGASGFTTIELKTNFLGTATEGTLSVDAVAVHAGRTTQVWDATVTHVQRDRAVALFRCTQAVLWPR